MDVTLEGLFKGYVDGEPIVKNVNLTLKSGEFHSLLGSSGCGKTTTLRMVAGLGHPDRGRILVGDRVLFDSDARVAVPPHKRHIGMVFQSYAVWPHMSVFQNVSYPLRVERRPRAEVERLTMRALDLVGLGEFRDRSATKLSGGQQQRVALARAIVHEPSVLLMDEPLSNLDAKLREQMRDELRRLQLELGLTALYVTHDQSEALALSDRISVMRHGEILQIGTPGEIYEKPVNAYVADFIGSVNKFGAVMVSVKGPAQARMEDGSVLTLAETCRPFDAGDRVHVCVRPETVQVHADQPASPVNRFAAEVISSTYGGASIDYRLKVFGTAVRALGPASIRLVAGQRAWVSFPRESTMTFPDDAKGTGSAATQSRRNGCDVAVGADVAASRRGGEPAQ